MKRKSESTVNFSRKKFVLPARLGNPSQTPFPPLLDELVAEILSWLPVKSLLRCRCVCKSWYSLIFHPSFVKLHLQKSPRNILFTLSEKYEDEDGNQVITGELSSRSLHCCSMRSFLNDPSSAIGNGGFSVPFDFELIVGVCNGLVCVSGLSRHDYYDVASVQLWNPATRMRSEELPSLQSRRRNDSINLDLGFGYDYSSDTYKVVAVIVGMESCEIELRVLCLGENIWRKIASWPQYPKICAWIGEFVNGTLNWLAQVDDSDQCVIFSFNLKKERYKYLSLPESVVQTTPNELHLSVLRGYLCLGHNPVNGTHFFLWQMKEFGVEQSWTMLLNVSYEHLPLDTVPEPWLFPLCMSKNGDVMLLTGPPDFYLILCNGKDNRVQKIEAPGKFYSLWNLWSRDYVQSLVLPYRD